MRQNEKNRSLNKAAGVEGKISIPGEKSFFDTGVPDASCDVIVSQEAFLHAGAERHKVIEEASRVLKPGGRMVFTDFMQTKEADNKEVEVVSAETLGRMDKRDRRGSERSHGRESS